MLYSFSLKTCSYYAIHNFYIKKSFVISPRKKIHLIIAFCVNTHAIFSIYRFAPRELCVLDYFSTELDPCHYTPRTPLFTSFQQTMKAHLLVSALISVAIFSSLLPPISESLEPHVNAAQCRSSLTWFRFKIKLHSCFYSSEPPLTGGRAPLNNTPGVTSAITCFLGQTLELRRKHSHTRQNYKVGLPLHLLVFLLRSTLKLHDTTSWQPQKAAKGIC